MKIEIFKLSGSIRYHIIEIEAPTEAEAITKAKSIYVRLGLIGRYYVMTANGETIQINN